MPESNCNIRTTKKGGTLYTLEDTDGLLSIVCSICSRDAELFPEPFKVRESYFKRNSAPCACTKYIWSPDQVVLKVSRVCNEKGYTLHEILGEGKMKDRVVFTCNRHKRVQDTTTVQCFLQGDGCVACGKEAISKKKSKKDTQHIQEFLGTGAFLDGTTFTRDMETKDNVGRLPYWDVFCPSCSVDKYVQSKVCSGVFKVTRSSLKRGANPCRCSNSFRWTKEQRELDIKEACAEHNKVFLSWEGEYINCTSKINWLCSKGHKCTSNIETFLNRNTHGCNTCRDKNFQYYKHRMVDEDFMYFILLYDEYNYPTLKVGRTFDCGIRFKTFQSLGFLVEPIAIYKGTHKQVVDIEVAKIHRVFDSSKYKDYTTGSLCGSPRECYWLDCAETIYEAVRTHAESELTLHRSTSCWDKFLKE